MEQIRQAETLDQVRRILGEPLEEESDQVGSATWASKTLSPFLWTKVKRISLFYVHGNEPRSCSESSTPPIIINCDKFRRPAYFTVLVDIVLLHGLLTEAFYNICRLNLSKLELTDDELNKSLTLCPLTRHQLDYSNCTLKWKSSITWPVSFY